uniref:Ricin B lectin domain-containing protein n=1 Tax=Romanomermis culicivorax TaxID=13658 RepID=A0A915KJC4_ROMCU
MQVNKPDSGAPLTSGPKDTSPNNRWTLQFQGPYFSISLPQANLCAQPLNGQAMQANTPLVLGPKSQKPFQKNHWFFVENDTIHPANAPNMMVENLPLPNAPFSLGLVPSKNTKPTRGWMIQVDKDDLPIDIGSMIKIWQKKQPQMSEQPYKPGETGRVIITIRITPRSPTNNFLQVANPEPYSNVVLGPRGTSPYEQWTVTYYDGDKFVIQLVNYPNLAVTYVPDRPLSLQIYNPRSPEGQLFIYNPKTGHISPVGNPEYAVAVSFHAPWQRGPDVLVVLPVKEYEAPVIAWQFTSEKPMQTSNTVSNVPQIFPIPNRKVTVSPPYSISSELYPDKVITLPNFRPSVPATLEPTRQNAVQQFVFIFDGSDKFFEISPCCYQLTVLTSRPNQPLITTLRGANPPGNDLRFFVDGPYIRWAKQPEMVVGISDGGPEKIILTPYVADSKRNQWRLLSPDKPGPQPLSNVASNASIAEPTPTAVFPSVNIVPISAPDFTLSVPNVAADTKIVLTSRGPDVSEQMWSLVPEYPGSDHVFIKPMLNPNLVAQLAGPLQAGTSIVLKPITSYPVSDNQYFIVKSNRLVAMNDHKLCLTASPIGSTRPGSLTIDNIIPDSKSQIWRVRYPNSDNRTVAVYLHPLSMPNQVLAPDSPNIGSFIKVVPKQSLPSQLWFLVRLPNNHYLIRPADSDQVAIQPDSPNEDGNLRLQPRQGDSKQLFTVDNDRLRLADNPQLVICVKPGQAAGAWTIKLSKYNPNDNNQKWRASTPRSPELVDMPEILRKTITVITRPDGVTIFKNEEIGPMDRQSPPITLYSLPYPNKGFYVAQPSAGTPLQLVDKNSKPTLPKWIFIPDGYGAFSIQLFGSSTPALFLTPQNGRLAPNTPIVLMPRDASNPDIQKYHLDNRRICTKKNTSLVFGTSKGPTPSIILVPINKAAQDQRWMVQSIAINHSVFKARYQQRFLCCWTKSAHYSAIRGQKLQATNASYQMDIHT